MISYMISYNIFVLCEGLCGATNALPQQSEPGGIFQRQDRFGLAGGRSGVVCAPSTPLQLHLVSYRRQGGQQYSQGGVPLSLVYFSTFEPIELTQDSIM